MSRTSNVHTRVEPEIKEQAEQIFARLGIPMSNAVNLFLHQVVLQQGFPFELKLEPSRKERLDLSKMTKEEIDAELQKGYDDILAGRVVPAEEVHAEMKRRYGI